MKISIENGKICTQTTIREKLQRFGEVWIVGENPVELDGYFLLRITKRRQEIDDAHGGRRTSNLGEGAANFLLKISHRAGEQ